MNAADATDAGGRHRDESRELDVLLLGATGFTGGLVAHELATRIQGTRLRWGIAGRDVTALERLAAKLPDTPTVVRVDVTDVASLDEMAKRTRVLATTVGPYARLGVDVARACAQHGTHYADITGEEGFVRTLEREIDATARETGATMVVCCGFDSVPHDLGVRFAVSHLPDDHDVVVRGYVRASGRMSGGTARTALDTLSEASRTPEDPSSYEDGVRPAGRLMLGTHRPRELGGWAVPMPTVDPLIVLRSARVLPGYGATFNYGHFAHLRRTATLVGAGAGLGTAALAARTRPGRALLERMLPSPGEGPDAQTRAAGRFTVLLIGAAYGPREEEDVRVVARVRGGDPGYGETSRMLAEAALTLAGDERPDVAGVVTPAIGLGAPYQRRLETAGMRFELVSRTP
jgi:saccharopine dehydrogenase (NAD+, L-glutamate forming)